MLHAIAIPATTPARLRARTACFAPGVPIPHALLCRTLQRADEQDADEQGQAQMRDALALLIRDVSLRDHGTGAVLAREQAAPDLDADAFTAVIEHLIQRAGEWETMEPPHRSRMGQHYQHVAETGEQLRHPSAPTLLLLIGAIHEHDGNQTAAERSYRRAIALTRTIFGDNDPTLAVQWLCLGHVLTTQRRPTIHSLLFAPGTRGRTTPRNRGWVVGKARARLHELRRR